MVRIGLNSVSLKNVSGAITRHVALAASCEELFGPLTLVDLIRFGLGTPSDQRRQTALRSLAGDGPVQCRAIYLRMRS